MRRPLALLTAAYAAGIVAARFLYPLARDTLGFIALPAAALAAAGLLLLPRRYPRWPITAGLLPLFFLLALMNYQGAAEGLRGNLQHYAGDRVLLEGRVAAEPVVYPDRVVYLLETEKVYPEGRQGGGAEALWGRVRLVAEGGRGSGQPEGGGDGADQIFAYGDRLRVQGKLHPPIGPRNPGGFDYGRFLLSQGAGAQLYLRAGQGEVLPPRSAGRPRDLLIKFLFSQKDRAQAFFQENLPGAEAALLGGILFGLRSGLPPGVEENFRASGVSHLLAVSGLHVGMVALLVVKALGLLGLGGEKALLWSLPAAALFALFTGLRPAVLRAFLMLVILAVHQGLGRDRDFPSALALAALASLLVNPFFLFMPGFQLSYAGIAAIVYLYRDFEKYFFFLPKTLQGIAAASLAAQLGVAPLTAYHFQQVSLVALLTNLLLVAAMAPLLGGGLLATLLAPIWPLGATLVIKLLSPLLSFFLAATDFFSSLPLAVLVVPSLPLNGVWLAYGSLAAWICRERIKQHLTALKSLNRKQALALLLLISLLLGAGLIWDAREAPLLEVTFLDVGQGASVFIRTPAGRTILVDTGGALFPHSRDPGKEVLVPFLRHRKVKRLDLLIISHPHVDHYGGAFALLDFRPPRALAVGSPDGEEGYMELLRWAEERGVEVVVISAGNRLALEPGLEMQVLHPQSGSFFSGSSSAENDNSLVLKLAYREVSFLLTGDIEKEGEKALIEGPYCASSTVLQVPHHGSNSSSGTPFLEKVNPVLAVIPVGSNPFGHPSPAVLERSETLGIEVYRTDLHGAVTVLTDGSRYTVKTMLGGEQPLAAVR